MPVPGGQPNCARRRDPFVKNGFLQLTLREFPAFFGNKRLWMAFAVITGIFALTGPFGTYEGFSLPGRIAYWTVMQAACWTVALTSIVLLGAALGRSAQGDLAITIAGAALAGLPIAAFIVLSKAIVNGAEISVAHYGEELIFAIPISVLLGLLASLAIRQEAAGGAGTVHEGQSGRQIGHPELLARLSQEKRGVLHYLTMQDHYVEVVTANGRELVLLRFADALREVPEGLGLRIHRSHWVALAAIQGWRRDNGRLLLTMPDGTELPVSRSYLGDIKAAGFG